MAKSSPGLMRNDLGTLAAALKLMLPACEAVMVQEPAPVRWTVDPATLQLPLAEKLTARLEDAVALIAKSGSPKFLAAKAPKVMVWLALLMENDCGTSVAGLLLASPACEAVIVQEPAPVMWTVKPLTVQLPLAPKVTVNPEVAVALTVKSASPKILLPSPPNVIVWLALLMENDCGTSVAGLLLASPACEAVIVQGPAPVMWTVEPVTVQLPLAPKVTVNPEVAAALTVKSASPKILFPSAPNVIVWLSFDTVRSPTPLLGANPESPAKVAPITPG